MTSPRPDALLHGPFTTAMARDHGVTSKQLRGAGWRQLVHGVHVAAEIPDSLELRCAAVRLVLPDDAVVGLTAGAWLHGADVRDRRTDTVAVWGVPVTSPTRTAFDLARKRDLIEAVVGVDAMLNRGGCDLDELVRYVATHRGWRGVRYADAALLHAEPLAESPMFRSATTASRSPTSTMVMNVGWLAPTTTVRTIANAGASTSSGKSASATNSGGIDASRHCTSPQAGGKWCARLVTHLYPPAGTPTPPIMHKRSIWRP